MQLSIILAVAPRNSAFEILNNNPAIELEFYNLHLVGQSACFSRFWPFEEKHGTFWRLAWPL